MRASRLLSILTTLQAKGQVTAPALAEACEVSVRTIYRDIDALAAAGIPVYAERGAEGGFRLLDGYRVRLNGLSAAETDALFMAGLPGPAAALGLDSAMNAAQTKLVAALPQNLRANAGRMQARFHLDAPGWFGEAEEPPHLRAIADALLADQPLTGGLEPRLGASHLRILTVTGFPTATTPGLLDELNRLAFPYRWSTRAILLDKTDATKLLTKIRRQWFAKRKSIAAILKEVMTNEASVLVDTDAANKAADADMALQELGADYAGMAYVTATVTVWDEDPRAADEKLRLVEKVIQG
ncbi:MAG: HTH domain-containing protein, partial [Bradyrhizobium sp.]|nr:HTH domain-containing protein [Bradyrhizobium sp.]